MQTAHTTNRQTRARGIVVALYRGKVVALYRGKVVEWWSAGRVAGAGAPGPACGRGKLRAGESWREARKFGRARNFERARKWRKLAKIF